MDNPENVVNEARNQFQNIRYLRLGNSQWKISCHAKNVALKLATGDLIIYTDPEILHVGETLHAIVSRWDKNVPAIYRIWTMGEYIYRELGEEYFVNPQMIIAHPYAQFTDGNLQNTHAPNSDFAITGSLSPTGCMFGCAKEDLIAVGGWDEEFVGYGFDDFDLFARLGLYHRPLLWVTDVDIVHQWHLKAYPFNIHDAATANGKRSEERIHRGEYRANIDKDWGNPNG